MLQTVCPNGHYYDGGVYSTCPYCNRKEDDQHTVPIKNNAPINIASFPDDGSNVTVTVPMNNQPGFRGPVQSVSDLDEKTTFFTEEPVKLASEKTGEAVVGWLVCVKGVHSGEDFRLHFGQNFIGRSAHMDVCLAKEETVSRERHAAVLYDPKENRFWTQMGDSKGLVYINGALVTGPTVLKKNDIISVGAVDLMFVPLCDDVFRW